MSAIAFRRGDWDLDFFTCPICGSHYWGTSFMREWRGKLRLVRDVEEAIGHCNGWYKGDGNYTKCEFAWNRNEDEWVMGPRPDVHEERTAP